MILCKHCGQEIPSTDPLPTACPTCGKPLSVDSVSTESDATNVAAEENIEKVETQEENQEETQKEDYEENISGDSALGESDNSDISPLSDSPEPKSKRNILIACGVGAVVLILIFVLFNFNTTVGVTSMKGNHYNPTVLSYVKPDGMGLVQNGKMTNIFSSQITKPEDQLTMSQMFASAPPNTVNSQNFVTLDNGDVVYIDTVFSDIDPATGQPAVSTKLYLKPAQGEPKVLDERAQMIFCHSGDSVYYTVATEDNQLVQKVYQNGEIKLTADVTGEPRSFVTEVSLDSTLAGMLVLDENMQGFAKSGYMKDGKSLFFPETMNILSISKDGKQVYTTETTPENPLPNLHRVKDFSTGETELLATSITDSVLYLDDGSIAVLADCDISTGSQNPVGNIYFHNASTGKTEKVAENATAIVEAYPRSYGWMNENVKDLLPSELANNAPLSAPLFHGQIHYIDSVGDLKVIAEAATPGESGLEGLTIADAIYDPQTYTLSDDLFFMTASADSLYWSKGKEVYRYNLGSLSAPQSLPLDDDITTKLNSAAQMGYLVTGKGNIIEETGDKVLLKIFDEDASTVILEDMGTVTLVGLDNSGENIYFISEDQSLYSKSVSSKSNPKQIASEVKFAATTSDGLYLLRNYDDEKGGTLEYIPYGEKTATIVGEGIMNISSISLIN